MASHGSSEERRAINQHLHRMHDGYAVRGSTLNRMVEHDLLHESGAAGLPPHIHPEAGSLEAEEIQE